MLSGARRRDAAKVFLVALWGVCAYRAATQSLVHDEALTYQLYLSRPLGDIFQVFSANHHFLNTLLMYVCTALLGFSEWVLRLPALAGAALYFTAVYRICRYAFGTDAAFLLAVPLLTLHPFLLDFMVAARGYGMALALYLWSLARLLPYIEEAKTRTRRHLAEAGFALALSVVANLVFLIPAAVLAAAVVYLLRQPAPDAPVKKSKRREPEAPSVWVHFALPIAAVAFVFFLVSPLDRARSGDFYAGTSTALESLRSLAASAVEHRASWRGSRYAEWGRDFIAFFLAPAILLAGLAIQTLGRRTLALLAAAPAVGSALLALLLHIALGVPYPEDRTGIYFLPLTLLTLASLAHGAAPKSVARPAFAVSLALVALFASQWNVRKFLVWEYDADSRGIAAHIAAAAADKRPDAVRVGVSWILEPSLNFYRETNGWTWMEPVTRETMRPGFHYYVIAPHERAAIEALKLKPVYAGPSSQTVLAVP